MSNFPASLIQQDIDLVAQAPLNINDLGVILSDEDNANYDPTVSRELALKPQAKQLWQKALSIVRMTIRFNRSLKTKQYELRKAAEDELLTSEREYYSRLSVLVECFMKPLIDFVEKKVNKLGITEDTLKQVRIVFQNIEPILGLAKELLQALELAHSNPHQGQVGKVFIEFVDYLRFYSVYCNSFDKAIMALEKLRSENPYCDAFISAIEAQPCCKGRGIDQFMIEPVQRVPRYKMLIEALIRHSPPGHGNNPKLTEALEKVKEVADGIDMDMGSCNARLKVAYLSVAWGGVDFTAPHRMFLKEGVLVKTDRHGSKRKSMFLLFNDLICYGDRIDEPKFRRALSGASDDTTSHGDRYKLRFKAPLLECLIVDTSMVYSTDGAHELYIELEENPKAFSILKSRGVDLNRVLEAQLSETSFFIHVEEGKSLVLTASTVQEKEEWVAAIADALNEISMENKQHRNGQRRLSSIKTQIEENHRDVVANPSSRARFGSFLAIKSFTWTSYYKPTSSGSS